MKIGATRCFVRFTKQDLEDLKRDLTGQTALDLYWRARNEELLRKLNTAGHVYDPDRGILYRIPPEPELSVPVLFHQLKP